MAKGYLQQYDIYYNGVFDPVTRWDTIRTLIALVAYAYKNWQVFQLDVKSAFLHLELLEDVYMDKPLGYEKGGR